MTLLMHGLVEKEQAACVKSDLCISIAVYIHILSIMAEFLYKLVITVLCSGSFLTIKAMICHPVVTLTFEPFWR